MENPKKGIKTYKYGTEGVLLVKYFGQISKLYCIHYYHIIIGNKINHYFGEMSKMNNTLIYTIWNIGNLRH